MSSIAPSYAHNDDQEHWTLRQWKEWVSLRPELVAMAREIAEEPTHRDIVCFRVALTASKVKREMDSSAIFTMPSENDVREIIYAFAIGQVIDLDSRRAPMLLKRAGMEVESVSIVSVMPPEGEDE